MRLISLVVVSLYALLAVNSVYGDTRCEWDTTERIVAVGDVHGDVKQFVTVLRLAKLIDENQDWAGGKSHLVQVGDILDRGPDSRKAFDLIMKLQVQAAKAGGRVHPLIGNHEAMVLADDFRYLSQQEYKSYGGKAGVKQFFSDKGKYGAWIRQNNAIIRINDTIFCHAGLSPTYNDKSLLDINTKVRNHVLGKTSRSDILWYRGLSKKTNEELDKELSPMLSALKATRIVVGHTVSKSKINVRGDGRVIMIDVGMSQAYGGKPACLINESGKWFAVYTDKTVPLTVAAKPSTK